MTQLKPSFNNHAAKTTTQTLSKAAKKHTQRVAKPAKVKRTHRSLRNHACIQRHGRACATIWCARKGHTAHTPMAHRSSRPTGSQISSESTSPLLSRRSVRPPMHLITHGHTLLHIDVALTHSHTYPLTLTHSLTLTARAKH